uniref:Uncharacterized protein n=1 Tax=Arundo donax TaxID=35708 RepID=A0A0A9FHU3_ARUDO
MYASFPATMSHDYARSKSFLRKSAVMLIRVSVQEQRIG